MEILVPNIANDKTAKAKIAKRKNMIRAKALKAPTIKESTDERNKALAEIYNWK